MPSSEIIKRLAFKTAYESLAKANMAVNGIRTGLDLQLGAHPLSPPAPKVEKADRIRKVMLALWQTDLRYGDTCMDHRFFHDPMQDIADVTSFDLSSFSSIGRSEMNRRFLEEVRREDPDLVFTAIVRDELLKRTIRHVSENTRSITCNWFTDDHWRFDTFGRFYAPHFNYCVSVDPVSFRKYERLGYSNILLSQWAANPHIHHKPERVIRDLGATFIGQDYADRGRLVSMLGKQGIRLQCYGAGWPDGHISCQEMDAMYHRSKINLNFSSSALGPTKQIKSRIFDICASGGFVLTEEAPGLSDCYEIGKEIAVFEGIEDAAQKIAYYLENDEEREAIAERGYQRTIKEHLYQHRLKEVFDAILSGNRLSEERGADPEPP